MRNISIAVLGLVGLLSISCNNDPEVQEPTDTVVLNDEINDFVWKGMNAEYYWQDDVPNLADSKDDVIDDYYNYLNGYSISESLFESLLFDAGNTDRFSWYIDDYNDQAASFRGVNDAYGFEFSVARLCGECDEVIGYVTYVVPDSPAADVDMKRGDMFYKFDGVELNINNYTIVNNYYSGTISSISLEFNTITNGVIEPNGKNVTLNLREVTENPVHYSDIITNSNGTQIGYLVYNGFKYTFHNELNDAFGDFKSAGIQELVLDLRYNGGGSVLTSAYLASMIHAQASSNEVFAKLIYNNKNSGSNGAYPFYNTARIYDKNGDYTNNDATINRINTLNRIHVIVSRNTASASEMIINGLRAYLGDSNVVLIGTTTYGKNVGSYTVYDSPDFSSTNINSNHTVAMQPITFKIFNKLDQSEYTNGFTPDFEQVEYISEMKPFGDTSEPLLKKALDNILGIASKSTQQPTIKSIEVLNSLDKKKFSKEMYILPTERTVH